MSIKFKIPPENYSHSGKGLIDGRNIDAFILRCTLIGCCIVYFVYIFLVLGVQINMKSEMSFHIDA